VHELSIANGIIERAREAAAEHGHREVEALTVELGEATHVNPSQLRVTIETVADGTPVSDATVTIEPVEPRAACDCGWEGTPPAFEGTAGTVPAARCPECGSRTEFTRGKECRLASIEVPDETATPEDEP
jgi:hydrogenase nickel incorporation protein HypA/HybF